MPSPLVFPNVPDGHGAPAADTEPATQYEPGLQGPLQAAVALPVKFANRPAGHAICTLATFAVRRRHYACNIRRAEKRTRAVSAHKI